ncbi:MAG TPA: DUF1059 domain-containing protein [Myxococcaceae bacterium]|jgi:Protein of unknown function (DUF1059).|nr:DUF1059 domain-containing protein [Myxococcaceae bacterium]
MFTISCADTGANCPRTFVSDTQVELLEQIHRHIAAEHPEQAKTPPSAEKVQTLIKKV